MRVLGIFACLAALWVVGAAAAVGQGNPLNDLFALGQGTGDAPATVPIMQRPEPPFEATPLAKCGPGSHEQPDVDGRVPAGSAKDGLNCNVSLVSHEGTEGGFRTYRYIDTAGHE